MALDYSEVIESRGIILPYLPHIITPKIERPLRNGRYESGERKALSTILKKGDRVLELGAGIGFLSALTAKTSDVSSITAIEANPELIPVIQETYRLNGISNIDLRNGVVSSNSRKRVDFFVRADFWGSSLDPDTRAYARKVRLPNFDFNALIAEIDPTVIVCDIEGAELTLFDKADLSNVRELVLELHPKVYGDTGVEAVINTLERHGLGLRPVRKPTTVRSFKRLKVVPRPSAKATREHIAQGLLPDHGTLGWHPQDAKVMVATCMKDEGPFILEWVAWNKAVGIDDIVVFSNHCTDGSDRLLDRLSELGYINHLPNPALATQSTYYQPIALAYAQHLREFRRAGFFFSLDVDEFINIRTGDGLISDLLEKTGPFDVLSLTELNHGSNRHENYERGWITDLFPQHQSIAPGRHKAKRGVKSIVRLSDRVQRIRNHRPSLHRDRGAIVWLDGSGNPTSSFLKDESENGLDCRGTYDLAVLDHYPLRSLNSYLVKMFRGDVVINDKMVSLRYWRTRDRDETEASKFNRKRIAQARRIYRKMLRDEQLQAHHEGCCEAHEKRIDALLEDQIFAARKEKILSECW